MADDRRYDEFETEVVDEDAADPALAFDALRSTVESLATNLTREMTTIRKGVEYTLDQMDQRGVPIDYSTELGLLSQSVATLTERLQSIEQSPVIRNGPEHYVRILERSGEGLVRTAAQRFQEESRDFQRAARELAEHTQSALTRKQQTSRMWLAVASGMVVGPVLLIILLRVLPFSADSRVAAFIMGEDRVSAGRAMIRAADPALEDAVSTGGWIYETNREVLDTCIAAMFRSRQEQQCMLTLPVVEKGSS